MSLYNMMNGVNQATFFILPMLDKHPDEYPRFRDCFIGKLENDKKEVDQYDIPLQKLDTSKRRISVYTRVGGGNREGYQKEIKILQNTEGYIQDYDDDFDTTFATFLFNVPKKWEKDFDLISNDKLEEISKEYQKQIIKTYPKLKEKILKMFN